MRRNWNPEPEASPSPKRRKFPPSNDVRMLETPEELKLADEEFGMDISHTAKYNQNAQILRLPKSVAMIINGRVVEHRGKFNMEPPEMDRRLLSLYLAGGASGDEMSFAESVSPEVRSVLGYET